MTQAEALQAGGVLAFAGLVLYILRELRPFLKGLADSMLAGFGDLRDELFEVRITIAAMLERDRIRDNRRRRDTSNPPALRVISPATTPVPTGEFDTEETTDIAVLIEKHRAAALVKRGERSPRPGTHHDKEP